MGIQAEIERMISESVPKTEDDAIRLIRDHVKEEPFASSAVCIFGIKMKEGMQVIDAYEYVLKCLVGEA